ncbi:MAG: lipoprotein signal peptidase [Prevotellaceae bacterium]|nr:lipoprotein signal peptidase [Prevotellaceae bacterium]
MTKQQKLQAVVSVLIFLVILIIDQVIKISVKTGMTLHESIRITDWFYILYIENNGMAWGMSIMPKIMLTLFRLVAIFAIGWYISRRILKGARWVYIVLLSMMLAGAAGNLIDCMFYGVIFSGASTDYVSYFVPWGTGYAPFLEGRVVDMFYFPLIVTDYPDWFPFWGGQKFVFFSPIFNFADASISVSFVALLLFCRQELQRLCK